MDGEDRRTIEMIKEIDSMKVSADFKDIEGERAHADLLLLSHYSPSSHHIKVYTSTKDAKVSLVVILVDC